MVKYRATPKGYETGSVITTKSPYGSHADMVVENHDVQNDLGDLGKFPINDIADRLTGEHEVICKDDRGYYITSKDRLDNGLADPNRYSIER
jgi:hypothetical protein